MRSEPTDPLVWKAFEVVAISMIQVLTFVLIFEAVVETYVENVGEISEIFGFGMQVNVAVYLLSILAGINSLAQIFIKDLGVRMVAPLCCAAIWIAYWGNIADVVPNRFIFLSTLGMIALYLGVLFGFNGPSDAVTE